MIAHVHSVEHACSTLSSPLEGTGLGVNCENSISYYYIGFALTLGGLIVLALVLVGTAQRARERKARHERAVVSKMEMEKKGPFRNAA